MGDGKSEKAWCAGRGREGEGEGGGVEEVVLLNRRWVLFEDVKRVQYAYGAYAESLWVDVASSLASFASPSKYYKSKLKRLVATEAPGFLAATIRRGEGRGRGRG